MKLIAYSLIIIVSSVCFAGGAGGGGGVRPEMMANLFINSNDHVYSMGNDGQAERVVIGNWIQGVWETKRLDLPNSESLNDNWMKAIEKSKIMKNWVEIR